MVAVDSVVRHGPRARRRLLAVRAAIALVVAMGVGRFAYTPILPLMEHQVGLSPSSGASLATSNYLGYLIGAVVASVIPSLTGHRLVFRGSLVALVVSLGLMPALDAAAWWWALRLVAGVASALVFVYAVRAAQQGLTASGGGTGWVFGGVGAGIALSGAAVLGIGAHGSWVTAWLVVTALAGIGTAMCWQLTVRDREPATATAGGHASTPGHGDPSASPARHKTMFAWLTASYFLQGLGYIVTATFLVAALSGGSAPKWLGSSAWIVVGLAAVPSCVLWAWLAHRSGRAVMLVLAQGLQAVAVVVPAFTGSTAAAFASAVVFGATFMGIVTLALGEGDALVGKRAPALMTAAYGVGQVIGPVAVAPLLSQGYGPALEVAGAIVALGAFCAAGVLRAGRVRGSEPDRS